MRNLLTDVAGIKVGNVQDEKLKSGVTVIIPDEPVVASVHVMGGAPGTRETDLLAPEQTVETVDALVLSGGSAFGLDAPGGVMNLLAQQGRGLIFGDKRVPIVPGAILFDLVNGGDKDWGSRPPYFDLGQAAALAVADEFALGSVGAGTGATTANLKGGLGSASVRLESGVTVAALVAANPIGRVTIGESAQFWAAPFEVGNEFGGLGLPPRVDAEALRPITKVDGARNRANTAIAVVATDAVLTKAQCKRLAIMAHDGVARAIWPAHMPFDGDLVFAISTGKRELADPAFDMIDLGAAAASTMSRSIARGIYEASAADGDTLPTWKERFGAKG